MDELRTLVLEPAKQWASAHSGELLAVVGVAIAFRVLSSVVQLALAKRYKSEDEVRAEFVQRTGISPASPGSSAEESYALRDVSHTRRYATAALQRTVATYRLVGTLHHCIQVPIALLVLLDKAMWADRLFAHSKLSTAMLIISSGYFAHDMVHAVEHIHVQGFAYVLHGAGCAAVYLCSLLQEPTMLHFYGAGFLMWEVSSFPLHARWFLFKSNASSKAQLINGLALILTFFLARIVWGYYLSYLFLTDILAYREAGPIYTCTTVGANLALNGLNTWWFSLMVEKARDTLKGRKDTVGKRD